MPPTITDTSTVDNTVLDLDWLEPEPDNGPEWTDEEKTD